ncbi:MAG: nucleotidyltransferase domain-containing protein [Candidatus Micrarchaeota archaeon]|nr:nucleotidyltransferase domain-containing protein [Candidatus Micrarchaeota archaeon]
MNILTLLKASGSEKILKTLLVYPKRRFTINELAKTSSVPFATTWGVVNNFSKAGVVDSEKIGRSTVISLRTSDIVKALKQLMELNLSPHKLVLDKVIGELKKIGVVHAYLFGSVARDEENLESDVDIVVVCKKDTNLDMITHSIYYSDKIKVVFIKFERKDELDIFLKGKENRRLI